MGKSLKITQQPRSPVSQFVNGDTTRVNYRLEENRLKSFALWPVRYIKPRSLSAAGFYYLGKRDIVTCFECQLNVCKWEKNDETWTDHARYASQCRFVRGIPCGNVPLNAKDAVMSLNNEADKRIERQHVTHEEGYDVCGRYDMSQLQKNLDDKRVVRIVPDDEADIWRQPVIQEKSSDSPVSQFVDGDTTKVNFRLEENRLKSFALWPVGKINPRSLSAAGFYYIGKPDMVRCFECPLNVCNWEKNADPWTYHTQYAPQCRFVRGIPCGNVALNAKDAVMPLNNEAEKKIERQPVTHEEGYDVCGCYDMSQLQKKLDDTRDTIVKVIFGSNEQPVEISLRELREAKYPRYANVTTRLATFDSWPMIGTQSKKRLAQAGFYFTGSDDLTICYYCGVGLRNWTSTDESPREHAKWCKTAQNGYVSL